MAKCTCGRCGLNFNRLGKVWKAHVKKCNAYPLPADMVREMIIDGISYEEMTKRVGAASITFTKSRYYQGIKILTETDPGFVPQEILDRIANNKPTEDHNATRAKAVCYQPGAVSCASCNLMLQYPNGELAYDLSGKALIVDGSEYCHYCFEETLNDDIS